ncbi:MAG: Wzz/FepE/Etk N-terminal domain-containing protein [Myxococcota bacterium]|nr:Wzz/FepE/Etk N-terminal domain-containing protein [Myxococcota bacterium]
MEEQGIRLDDLKAALLRRGRLIAVVTLACGLLGIFIASVLPNKYQSFATLLVEPQSISKRLVDGGVEEEALMNRLHLMTMQILSRARLSRIIDELGLYPEALGGDDAGGSHCAHAKSDSSGAGAVRTGNGRPAP